MPKVPTLGPQIVQSQSLPNVQVNPNAASGFRDVANSASKITDALSRTGQLAAQYVGNERKKADQVKAMQAESELLKSKNDLFYNDKDGYYKQKGQGALESMGDYEERYQKKVSEIESTLTSDRQREMFRNKALAVGVEVNGSLQKHAFSEGQKYDEQQSKSYLENLKTDAVLNYSTPGKVGANLVEMEAKINEYADRNGLDEESKTALLRDTKSKTHSEIMNRMVNEGDEKLASSYFNTVKGDLSSDDLVRIEKVLEEGKIRGEAQSYEDQIFSKHGGSMSQAMAEARKIDEPKLRDEVTSRLKSRFALADAEKRDRVENLHRSATDIIEAQGSVDAIPREQWAQFSLSERSALRSYAATKNKGAEPETKWEVYYDLQQLAANPSTKEQFKDLNLLEKRNDLSDAEFKELTKLQAGLRKGAKGAENELNGVRTNKQIVDDSLRQAGFDLKNDTDEVVLFRRSVDEEVRQWQDNNKKKINSKELQGIVDNLMIQGKTKDGFFGFFQGEKRLFELKGDEDKFEFEAENIPKSEKEKIVDTLKRRGLPVTADNVARLYSMKINRNFKNAN